MKSYIRIMLGAKSVYAEDCFKGGFIGVDFNIKGDLTKSLYENWRDFNKEQIPLWILNHPDKSKVAAGLACGFTWTIAKGIQNGDIVICPNGQSEYHVGEEVGSYYYSENSILPHRRRVNWFSNTISRQAFSDALKNSSGSIGTVSNITKYADEIEALIHGNKPATIISTDSNVEDVSEFAL